VGGITFLLQHTDKGTIDYKSGTYGQTGLDAATGDTGFFVEALRRKIDTHINLA